MKFADFQNREITLSEESWKHIQDSHPEVTVDEIAKTLAGPDEVRKSINTPGVELYYALKTEVPKLRYRSVVVKVLSEGRFVSSAMTVSKMKSGETLYKKT
jgi:hypothetical protein